MPPLRSIQEAWKRHGHQGINRVDELRGGDEILLETQQAWVTYRVTGQRVVPPDRIDVTYPVPGREGEPATEPLITLTTCNPKYSAEQRLIVSGAQVSLAPKITGSNPSNREEVR